MTTLRELAMHLHRATAQPLSDAGYLTCALTPEDEWNGQGIFCGKEMADAFVAAYMHGIVAVFQEMERQGLRYATVEAIREVAEEELRAHTGDMSPPEGAAHV